jgi:hypothetical protein
MDRLRHRGIGVLLLCVLAGAPALGTACALSCARDAGAAGGTADAGSASCHASPATQGSRLLPESAPSCHSHDAAFDRLAAALTAGRSGASVLITVVATAPLPPGLARRVPARLRPGDGPPSALLAPPRPAGVRRI